MFDHGLSSSPKHCGEFFCCHASHPDSGESVNSPVVSRVTWAGELIDLVQYPKWAENVILKNAKLGPYDAANI
jgi:hypothetical protein